MVSDVSISTALQQQANTANSKDKLADDFSQFLTLLTVQLQNQDPLSPMDTTEFTNQLVAFTGVEQQINTNQKLDSLVSMQLGSSFSAAQNYVGKSISYVSSEFAYTGEPAQLRYSLASGAEYSKVNVLNEFGDVVYTTDAAKSAGAHEFTWNGKTNNGRPAAPGTYEIVVDALDGEENPVNATTVVTGRVQGVESQNGSIYLLVGERAVSLGNVLNTSESNLDATTNNALTSALSYVGMDVTYINNSINHDGSTPTNIIYNLDKEADRAQLIVKNDVGQTVYVGDVDPDSGDNITTWNGNKTDGSPLPAGEYTFTIDAIDEYDQRVGYTSLSDGIVTGVESMNNNIYLNIGSKSVKLNNIVTANLPSSGS